jgi:CRISPR-associated DxTHG motif protein
MSSTVTLLTFLGTGNYQSCKYTIAGVDSSSVTFFSAALAAHLKPDLLVSLQTAKANQTHGNALKGEFECLVPNARHEPVTIPEGGSEQELWDIFTALTKHIPAGAVLHLDITHGFRSLPVLGFIALAYLRITHKVTIGGIHYGAWEARDQGANLAPCFDLTPFLTLLDWTAAADQFLATGDAARIGRLLCVTQQSLWQSKVGVGTMDLPKLLSTLGKCIEQAGFDRILLRTANLSISADSIAKQLDRIGQTDELQRHAPAFLQLLAPVKEQLTRHRTADLATLRDLIKWLAIRNRPDAALTLAAEWMVSWVMVKLGQPDAHSAEEARRPFEHCLNQIIRERSGQGYTDEATEHTTTLKSISSEEELALIASVASSIKEARNDLNHAGFRNQPLAVKAIFDRLNRIVEELDKFEIPDPSHHS